MSIPPPLDDAETVVRDGPPPGGPREPAPGRQLGWGMLLGALVLVAVAGGVAAAYFATRGGSGSSATTASTTTRPATTAVLPATQVFVPDVTGLKQAAAAKRLAGANLVPVVELRPTKKATGVVVSQQPKAGKRAKRGSDVTLVVDRGAPQVAVPDVSGMKVAAARSRLGDAGLKVQTTQVTQPGAAAGTVVSQAPAAGEKAKRGAAVTLSVAKAAPKITTAASTTAPTTTATPPAPAAASVPDLSGDDVQAASHALDDARLRATIQYVPGDTPLGSVVAQAPAAGASAKPASHVTVNASSGPNATQQQTVPDTTGQRLRQAVSTLNAAGLRLIFVKVPVSTRAQVGTVVEQTPAAGQTAPKNAQVLVYLGVTG